MADSTVVNMSENSPEYVAFRLMRDVACAEKKNLAGNAVNTDRAWILKTYAQCLLTVRSPHLVEDILSGQ